MCAFSGLLISLPLSCPWLLSRALSLKSRQIEKLVTASHRLSLLRMSRIRP